MQLKVNGENISLDSEQSPLTLENLIKLLGYDSRLVVVEMNGVIRPLYNWGNEHLKDGDVIEIVTIVGGG